MITIGADTNIAIIRGLSIFIGKHFFDIDDFFLELTILCKLYPQITQLKYLCFFHIKIKQFSQKSNAVILKILKKIRLNNKTY